MHLAPPVALGRAALSALLVVALSGCGEDVLTDRFAERTSSARPTTASTSGSTHAPPSLAGAEAAARAARTVRYRSETLRAKPGEKPTVEGRVTGAVDLLAGTGRATLDLVALREIEGMAGGAPSGLADLELSWTRTALTGRPRGGEAQTSPRTPGGSSLVERVPDDVPGLLSVLAKATGQRVAGVEQLGGARVTRVEGALPAEATVEAGVAVGAPEAVRTGPPLSLTCWLDDESKPVRVQLVVVLPPTGPLPTRTLTTTYEFEGWGEPLQP